MLSLKHFFINTFQANHCYFIVLYLYRLKIISKEHTAAIDIMMLLNFRSYARV